MPAGPASLALATGAALLPACLWYSDEGGPGGSWCGWIREEIKPPAEGDKRAKIAAMTQALADRFAEGIAEHPQDWHMLQPLWLADVQLPCSCAGRRVKVGLVCPYTWDVPGGVQAHVRDLAIALIGLGHDVSVITPADDDSALPPYIVSTGRAVPVPYNGAVARMAFGPLSAQTRAPVASRR